MIPAIRDACATGHHAGFLAAQAIVQGVTVDRLPLNLVEWGDGKTWSELARAAGVDFPSEFARREVRYLLTLEASNA